MNDRQHILRLIPHAGAMCLLDAIECWSDSDIVCTADSHRDAGNPLRRDGYLSALHLAEYGAQAMAIHGGLLAERNGGHAAAGMLVSIRDLQLAVERLDDLPTPLVISASSLVTDAGGRMYVFEAVSAGQRIGSGRVAVITIDEGSTAPLDGNPV